MFSVSYAASILGLDAHLISVEVDMLSSQLPSLTIVGLADKSIQEAKERIVSAIKNSGLEWPRKKIVVSLAPADLPKEGSSFDLPIAVGILTSSGVIRFDERKYIFVGELSLNGNVRKISGVLPIALMAKQFGFDAVFVPKDNAREASLVEGLDVYGVESLIDIVGHFNDKKVLVKEPHTKFDARSDCDDKVDFAHIYGQLSVKRAALIAAAGGHNILLVGSPGSGKSMISKALRSILPDMTFEESLEVTKIYSVANLLDKDSVLVTCRPFRSPHHTASTVSIVGGGKFPRPGEVTLAHRGILFLDEFPEFSQNTLEALRQPIEDKVVSITRASGSISFPSNFMLVAAMNPCKCGWLGDREKPCSCSAQVVEKYRKKISGPIMDRIDLQVRVNRVDLKDLKTGEIKAGEDSRSLKAKVDECRKNQLQRYKGIPGVYSNSDVPHDKIREVCRIEPDAESWFVEAAKSLGLSARSFYRLLRVSRTIADLDGADSVSKKHIAESLQYRIKDY